MNSDFGRSSEFFVAEKAQGNGEFSVLENAGQQCSLGFEARTLSQRLSSRLSRYLASDVRHFVHNAPLVSFTFDDIPDSASNRGARMLEDFGARGTFYIATSLLGKKGENFTYVDQEGVRALHRRGHEIALHSHAHLWAHQHSPKSFKADLKTNYNQLKEIDATITPTNFAYPYGGISLPVKKSLKGAVTTARGIWNGINNGPFDSLNVRAIELCDERITEAELNCYLKKTRKFGGWLIFVSHDISENPSPFGCTPDLFNRALEGAADLGLTFSTMKEAYAQTSVGDIVDVNTKHAWPRSLFR